MTYIYPQVAIGFRWNLLQRIKNEVGIEPMGLSDVGNQTLINFDRELTKQEKGILDSVMSYLPTFPPKTTNTVFKIEDIWEKLIKFNIQTGVEFNLYYSESVSGSGKFDQIELHAPKQLTDLEKAKVKEEFGKLIV